MQDAQFIASDQSNAPLLSEAKIIYLKAKASGRSKIFVQTTERSVRYLTQLLGDRPIDLYTRSDVNQFRDAMFERGQKVSSVRRTLNSVRAAVNFVCLEKGLSEISSFSGVYLGEDSSNSTSKRRPIPVEDISTIQNACHQLDDEARWLIALISDTGMRLAEATGLLKQDVLLDDKYPHIVLKPHPWRRLKTKGSERRVPLVGWSLWAAQRAIFVSEDQFLFPKYCNEQECKANSASGALNKWLSPRLPQGCVVHSFRHSMRDRLRAVECPPDIIDRIGGWSVDGIGERYGQGYPIGVLHKWAAKIEMD
jgi:integrase